MNVVMNGINAVVLVSKEKNAAKKENVLNNLLGIHNVKVEKVVLTIPDVVMNGNNVEEKIGKELLVVAKDHVLGYTNGILNVKVVTQVIILLQLDVLTNGDNVVEKAF